MTNVGWGAPRIHGELLKLGIAICGSRVPLFMPKKTRKPPSQTWRTFLDNHLGSLASVDSFAVPMATFRGLLVFFVLRHDRRRVVHFNITEFPCAAWTAQQIIEAFPENTAPEHMFRDRDGVYGEQFRGRVERMGIEEALTAPRSPWQNRYAERLVAPLRRQCLDHVIVLGEKHLRGIVTAYLSYCHRSRTHLSPSKDAPEPRAVQPPEPGGIVELPEVGGLHHRCERLAARPASTDLTIVGKKGELCPAGDSAASSGPTGLPGFGVVARPNGVSSVKRRPHDARRTTWRRTVVSPG